MNIDNQLLLGIVFITAGVAMGLLAYAAFLNRQEVDEEEQTEELPEDDAEALASPAQDQGDLTMAEPEGDEAPLPATSEAPTIKQLEPIAEPEPIVGTEAETVATQAEEGPTPSEPPVQPPAVSAELPTVVVDRDSATNRLLVKVDDHTYHSIEELQKSDDWSRVTGLFSDLLAWMIKAEEAGRDEEERENEETISKPVSMVQEINTILSEKLTGADSGPQAVRLMEGVGGSIRVYIGVESYSIEEVPDEQVKALIRQAVAEWEARQ